MGANLFSNFRSRGDLPKMVVLLRCVQQKYLCIKGSPRKISKGGGGKVHRKTFGGGGCAYSEQYSFLRNELPKGGHKVSKGGECPPPPT